jgi:hypothetical protein
MKSNKTKKVTADELEILQEEANRYTVGISGKRTRRPTKNRDQAYFDAAEAEAADAGTKGGLVAGSGYHYDRAYNGQAFSCKW